MAFRKNVAFALSVATAGNFLARSSDAAFGAVPNAPRRTAEPSTVPESSVWGNTTKVDLNQYNLPLEVAVEEWTANVLPQSAMVDAGIYLGARDAESNYVETLKFRVDRKVNPTGGLGLELLELAGGREDGVGITICSGLVEGGNAETSGILPGDSIVSLMAVVANEAVDGQGQATSSVEMENRPTECLGYDATVDAIMSLPEDWKALIVHVKRLRRKPKVTMRLQYPPYENEPDEVLELFAGENLRRAMLARGVKLNDVLSRRFDNGGSGDCGGEATCSTCVVSVQQGGHLLNKPSIQEEQMLVKNPRWRLACKAIVGQGGQEGDMIIRVNPRQW